MIPYNMTSTGAWRMWVAAAWLIPSLYKGTWVEEHWWAWDADAKLPPIPNRDEFTTEDWDRVWKTLEVLEGMRDLIAAAMADKANCWALKKIDWRLKALRFRFGHRVPLVPVDSPSAQLSKTGEETQC